MLLPPRRSRAVRVPAERAAELDEMWSFVGAKATEGWLWHAIEHHTGRVFAYVGSAIQVRLLFECLTRTS